MGSKEDTLEGEYGAGQDTEPLRPSTAGKRPASSEPVILAALTMSAAGSRQHKDCASDDDSQGLQQGHVVTKVVPLMMTRLV